MNNSTTTYYPRQQLNILMVSVPPTTKGPLPFLTELLISGLRENGHQITLAACWGHKDEGESAPRKIMQRFGDIRKILKAASSDRFDLIYIHSSLDRRALLRDLPLAAALRTQAAPVVIIFHGSQLNDLNAARKNPYFLGTQILFRLVSGVLVDSTEEQQAFLRLWPWSKVGVVPQPMAVNPSEVASLSVETKRLHVPTFLFAGRLIPEKGVLEVLEAYFEVRSQMPCRLVIAGDGPLAGSLRNMADARPDFKESIEFTGYLDRRAMWELYKRSDVLVLPTYHAEGMPTVILEAMACGLGLICTPIRGAADHLQEGSNVLFVPPQRADLLTRRMLDLLESQELLVEMKQANRLMSRTFEPKPVASRQIEVIQSIGILQAR